MRAKILAKATKPLNILLYEAINVPKTEAEPVEPQGRATHKAPGRAPGATQRSWL